MFDCGVQIPLVYQRIQKPSGGNTSEGESVDLLLTAGPRAGGISFSFLPYQLSMAV